MDNKRITYPNAKDENGEVHNIVSITPENRTEHNYYCLRCDKELVPVLSRSSLRKAIFSVFFLIFAPSSI